MAQHQKDRPAGKIWILYGLVLTAVALSLIASSIGTALVNDAFALHVGH